MHTGMLLYVYMLGSLYILVLQLLKADDFFIQVFSFKLRGAYNMMAQLPKEKLARGVICSSAGNHAQGVALAAKKLHCDAVIVMPVTTPEIKVSLCCASSDRRQFNF